MVVIESLDFSRANGGATAVTFRKDHVLFAQGAPADSVFYIQEGSVKITVLSEHGREGVIGIMAAGEFCGVGALAGQPLRMTSAVGMTDGAAMRIEKDVAVRMLRDDARFSDAFNTHLLARNIRVEADIVDHLFNSSEKRLARLLLLLADLGKEGASETIDADINQETLAEMIGTTRSRVSSFMNKFRQLGLIDYNGRIRVHNALLSVVLSDD